jgi:hypothetical protein
LGSPFAVGAFVAMVFVFYALQNSL